MMLTVLALLAILSAVVEPAHGATQGNAQPKKKPNLLFMMADQLRADAQGSDARFGGKPNTPNLDKLGEEGLRFTNAFSSTPTCTPARAAILTGQSPWNHGMLGYGTVAPVYPFEMPVALQTLGYTTSSIGKDHFGWDNHKTLPPLDPKTDTGDVGSGTPHGYQRMSIYDGLLDQKDDYHQWFSREMPNHTAEQGWPTLNMNGWMGAPYVFAEYLHPTAWVGQQAVDWISNASKTVPWFLKISFHRPHSPYDPPVRVLNATKASDLPTVQLAVDGWDNVFRGGADDPPGCGLDNGCGHECCGCSAWCGLMPLAAQELGRRSYYANVAFVDEWVGKVYNALKEYNFLENTFIIWTSDHGDGQEDHYHWRKGFPYQFSSSVPFMFRWPESYTGPTKTPRGTVVTDLVTELRDVFPTMLDAAGGLDIVPHGHKLDGTSLLCLLEDITGATCTHSTPGEDYHTAIDNVAKDGGTANDDDNKNNNNNRTKGWRRYLDLEHSTCYNNTNHWSALTDGKMKYVFNACPTCTFPPKEQLFNLTADPGERIGLHNNQEYVAELYKWRARMVAQFEAEGRGPSWVNNSVLQLRASETYGPNYPGHQPSPSPSPAHAECNGTTLAAGEMVGLEPNQGPVRSAKYCQVVAQSSLDQIQMVVNKSLCVQPTSTEVGATLTVAECAVAKGTKEQKMQAWVLPPVDKRPYQQVRHTLSNLCLTGNAAGTVKLAACGHPDKEDLEPEADEQTWILGASGRLCAASGCVSGIPAASGYLHQHQTRHTFVV